MSLPRGWARSVAQILLPDLVRQGMHSAQALRALQGAGVSYRRQEMLRDYRKYSGLVRYEKYWTGADRRAKPNLNMMAELDLKYPSNFKVYFKAQIENAWTGQPEEVLLSAFTDDLANIEGVENDFLDNFSERYGDLVSEWRSFRLVGVEHNSGFPY